MKKLMILFLLVSFMCFGEEQTEPKKSYEVVQGEEIDFLKTQLMKSNNKIDDLSKQIEALEDKGESNLGLTYNVDQIYQNSVQYYDSALEFLKWIIGGMLLVLGYLKWDGNKKYEKERKEITKELDKRVERMWEENAELKQKLVEQEKEVERKTLELNREIESINKEMDEKLKEVEYNTRLALAINKAEDEEKIEELKKLVEKYSGERKARIYFELSNTFSKLGEYQEVVDYLDKTIILIPEKATAYYNRGNAKIKLESYEEAIKDYDKTLELDSTYISGYYNRGNAKRKLESYEEAIKDYDKVIDLNSKHAEAYNNKGLANEKLKQYKKAIKNYDMAIKLKSQNKRARRNRKRVEEILKKLEDEKND